MKVIYKVQASEGDDEFLRKLIKQNKLLCAVVIEMMSTNPSALLSTVIREMAADKAVEVLEAIHKVEHKLYIDNPGEDLKWK